MRKPWKWIVGAVVVVAIALVVGPWVYINFIQEDAPPELQLTDATANTTDATRAPGSTSATTAPETAGATGIDGTWNVGEGSTAGYRAKEVLFGQDADAAGRTDQVTGSMEISGTTVTTGSFEVDMASVESDQSNRDDAYRGRIMNVDQFPTSTFELTTPIELGSIPEEGVAIHPQATGDITIHGVTKTVTIDLDAQLIDGKIEVVGHLPVKWSDFDIDDPSGGPATVTDNGQMEFKLVLSR
ncbi:MAG TPA: YceI family protein [Acidimicrobiia bacterium]|nr:YceI family protein [Acidimicrobiia bacterium]